VHDPEGQGKAPSSAETLKGGEVLKSRKETVFASNEAKPGARGKLNAFSAFSAWPAWIARVYLNSRLTLQGRFRA
jgi:hypothetical protein